MSRQQLNLVQGTLDLLILQTLSAGPAHGYGVSLWIRQQTAGALAVKDAALYQALHRMEGKGWVEAEWGPSENNRRARFYQLTPKGRRQLETEMVLWKRYAEAVFQVLNPVSVGSR